MAQIQIQKPPLWQSLALFYTLYIEGSPYFMASFIAGKETKEYRYIYVYIYILYR